MYTYICVCVSVCLHSFTYIQYIYYKLIIYPIVHPIVHPIIYAHVSSQNLMTYLAISQAYTYLDAHPRIETGSLSIYIRIYNYVYNWGYIHIISTINGFPL